MLQFFSWSMLDYDKLIQNDPKDLNAFHVVRRGWKSMVIYPSLKCVKLKMDGLCIS